MSTKIHCTQCHFEGSAKKKSSRTKSPYGAAVIIFGLIGIVFWPALVLAALSFCLGFVSVIYHIAKPSLLSCPKCKSNTVLKLNEWNQQNPDSTKISNINKSQMDLNL